MIAYVKLCGLAMMLIAGIGVISGYREHNSKRISELESFLLLLTHAYGQINRYLTPISDVIRGFSDEILEGTGFLKEAEEKGDLLNAFSSTSSRLSVGDEAKKILEELFSRLGGGYKEEVLKDIQEASEGLEKILEDERKSLPKNEKVISAITVALILGVFILLV